MAVMRMESVAQRRVGHLVDKDAEEHASHDGEHDGDGRIEPKLAHDEPGDVCADHDNVTMREVEQQDDAIHHGVAQRDERVDATQLETV